MVPQMMVFSTIAPTSWDVTLPYHIELPEGVCIYVMSVRQTHIA